MHADPNIDLRVLAYGDSDQTSFDHEIMSDVDWLPLSRNDRFESRLVKELAIDFNPDIIVIAGWLNRAYVNLTKAPELTGKKFIMAMDTPWRGTLRQHLARFALRSYISRLNAAMVTGERAWIYGRKLNIPESKLFKGQYGVDHTGLSQLLAKRKQAPWPKRFLFVGRYSEEKGIDELVRAYALYRERVDDPWPLDCCGRGEYGDLLARQEGVTDLGFVQPSELHKVLIESGALIMPSRFDPWPLALVEASAAGLPIVATYACGSAVENVRDHFNGFTCATGSSTALAAALVKMHNSHAGLVNFGERSEQLAAAYSTEMWLQRWVSVFENVEER